MRFEMWSTQFVLIYICGNYVHLLSMIIWSVKVKIHTLSEKIFKWRWLKKAWQEFNSFDIVYIFFLGSFLLLFLVYEYAILKIIKCKNKCFKKQINN